MYKEIVFLVLTILITLFIAILSTWWNWNNQVVGVKLHDIFFDVLPDLSDVETPFPNYILLVQLFFGIISFRSNSTYKYIAQFIFLQSILSAVRAVSVAITTLPNIRVYEHCEKEVSSFFQVLEYMIIYGTCGDYMFSGHTATAFLTYMFVHKHGSYYAWEILSGLLLGAQMFVLLLLRWHYSVDILIACIITWLVFRFYKRYEQVDYWSDFWFYFKVFEKKCDAEPVTYDSQVNTTRRKARFKSLYNFK